MLTCQPRAGQREEETKEMHLIPTAVLCALCGILACIIVAQASILEQRSVGLEEGALHEYIENSLCQGLDPYSACLYVACLCIVLRR